MEEQNSTNVLEDDSMPERYNPRQKKQSRSSVSALARSRQRMSKSGKPLGPNEPPHNHLAQQNLGACRPLLTPSAAVPLFFIVGVLFVPIGTVLLQQSEHAREVSVRYDNLPQCLNKRSLSQWADDFIYSSEGNGTNCTVRIPVDKRLDKTVHVYYELRNYYQGHRRYAQSISHVQLITGNRSSADGDSSSGSISTSESCEPESTLYLKRPDSDGDFKRKENLIKPCGLIAWTFFNDTFSNFQHFTSASNSNNASGLTLDESNIAWPSDRRRGRFSDTPIQNLNPDSLPGLRGGASASGLMSENEHLMNWMRVSTLKDFRKLYGRINASFEEGDVVAVEIRNRYNVQSFGGEKHIVLANNAVAGGRNAFLAIGYLVVGSLYLLFGVSLLLSHLLVRRKHELV